MLWSEGEVWRRLTVAKTGYLEMALKVKKVVGGLDYDPCRSESPQSLGYLPCLPSSLPAVTSDARVSHDWLV